MISNINIEQRKKDLAQIPQFINDSEFDYKFQEYSAIYYLTNEKLANLYNEINFTKYKTTLTVLASGDQAFNLILEGAERIDTFDCNRLAEQYAKLVSDIYTKNLNQNGLLIYNYGFNGLLDKYCSKEIVERKVTYDLGKLDRAHGLRKIK